MHRPSVPAAILFGLSAFALHGCGQQASTPAATGTPIGAAASDAEAQVAADAKAAELTAREQELAAREAALAEQEALAQQAKTQIAPAAPVAAKKPAAKPASSSTPAKKAPPPSPILVPSGTPLEVELAAALSSKTAQVGDPVQARLASDLVVDGRRAAKAGATISGSVTQVVSGSHKIGGTPTLGLSFSNLVAADGSTQAIDASYVAHGKSETGKDTAKILGGGAAGAVIGHQVDHDKGAVIGGLIGAGAGAIAANKTGAEVNLSVGQVLQSSTSRSFEVKP